MFSERPPSPSPKISLLDTSIGFHPSTRTIKFSQMGPGASSLDSRSTYQTTPAYQSTDTKMQMELFGDSITNNGSTSTMKPPSNSWIPGQCPQIFFKGLGRTTITLRPTMMPWSPSELKEMLQRITRTPFDFISLLKDGRILEDFSNHYENNCTLMANVEFLSRTIGTG